MCIDSRRATSARNSTSASFIRPTMSSSRASSTVETFSRLTSRLLIWSSLAAMLAGEPRDAVEGGPELLRRVAGEVGQRGQRLGELVGVDLLGECRGQAREGVDDVVRRGGALDRDLGLLLQLAGAGRLEGEEHRAEQRLDLDRGAGVGAELVAGVDLEGDLDVVAVELDVVDLADADAGDADLVAGLEATGLGEVGVVGVTAADDRQVVGPEGGDERARRSAARLIAPMITGLRSRNGIILSAHPRSHLSDPVLVLRRAR